LFAVTVHLLFDWETDACTSTFELPPHTLAHP
jgi:hypothetical protein